MRTTQEEARCCPSCDTPGTFINKRPATNAPRGTMVELYECRNDRCPDYVPPQLVGTGTTVPGDRYRWYIQVNPDGTIPPKGSGSTGPKAFSMPGVHSSTAQRARDNLAYLAAQDERGPNSREATEILRDIGGFL